METGNEKTPLRIDSIKDPALKKALEKQPVFRFRLEQARTYDDIIYAVESAAVDDGEGEEVVFDIEGYIDGYEDEKIEAETHPLEEVRAAIEFIRDNPLSDYENLRQRFKHIAVRNAVIAVWALNGNRNTEENE